jgi:hypothetical protein
VREFVSEMAQAVDAAELAAKTVHNASERWSSASTQRSTTAACQ